MLHIVRSMGLTGIEGYEVSVECYITSGLPAFEVVGLPDMAVKEARERVRAAIKNSGFPFPVSRITLNLAPAGTKKSGTIYDLPILVGILAASGNLTLPDRPCAFIGELSLEGRLRPVDGVLPMAMAARRNGVEELFLPADNAMEATLVDGLTVYPVHTVEELTDHLTGEARIEPQTPWTPAQQTGTQLDFYDVRGQENVKRAMEIAAAGGHNILLVGPPGSGKSMLSKRLPSILPDMTREEALEVTAVHSVLGLVDKEHPLLTERPFRSPHHTISAAGLAGGGSTPKPGEISLAHRGILFLDELPEFRNEVLEVLRQPLEDGVVTISRVSGTVSYPCDFMLVCAMNPCKCGWYGHPSGRCTCSAASVSSYLSRLSGPLLDRIDLVVDVPAVEFDDLHSRSAGEHSATIRERVNAARKLQQERLQGTDARCNAAMSAAQLRQYCQMDEAGNTLMKNAFEKLRMTARSHDRILKVARTIADLDGSEQIAAEHLAEAISYRSTLLDRL